MRRACRVALMGWLLCAACAKEHAESKPPSEAREAGSRAAGSRAAGAGEAGAKQSERAGEGGAVARAGRGSDRPAAVGGGAQAPVGATATAVLVPTDVHAAEQGDLAMRGNVTLRQSASSVDLSIMIRGCSIDLKSYVVSVKEGSDCSEETLLGPNWDGSRGEGIPTVNCLGTAAIGRVAHSRPNDSDAAWSLGGPARTDIVGRALAVYDPDTMQPLSCGVITLSPQTTPEGPPAPAPPLERAAPIAGLCLAQMFVRDNENPCPDPNEIVKCAGAHCDLNACVEVCSDYVDCMLESDEPCERAFVCDITAPCAECYGQIQTCTLNFCADLYACAAPATPDGPCSQLEACCALQGEKAASCLELVQAVKKYSGDPSCFGVMRDRDFFIHLEVACEFE